MLLKEAAGVTHKKTTTKEPFVRVDVIPDRGKVMMTKHSVLQVDKMAHYVFFLARF